MSVQGSAVRSMEERSRPGRGFSGGRGAGAGAAAGAGACWASEEGVRAKQARAAIAISERVWVGRMEARIAGDSLMRGISVRTDFGCCEGQYMSLTD